MHKRYTSYRFQVMWNHPKLMSNSDQFECYYETNFLDHAKYYALSLLGKGATVYVYDTELKERVKDFDDERYQKSAKEVAKADAAKKKK